MARLELGWPSTFVMMLWDQQVISAENAIETPFLLYTWLKACKLIAEASVFHDLAPFCKLKEQCLTTYCILNSMSKNIDLLIVHAAVSLLL